MGWGDWIRDGVDIEPSLYAADFRRLGEQVDERLGDEWPAFRHPSRPAFLQTLPHVHGTSGFFVARLRVRSA